MMGGSENRLTRRRLSGLREGYGDSGLERLPSAFFTLTRIRGMRRSRVSFSGERIRARDCPCPRSFFPSSENTRERALQSLMRAFSRYALSTAKTSNRVWRRLLSVRLSLSRSRLGERG